MADDQLDGARFRNEASAISFIETALWRGVTPCPHCQSQKHVGKLAPPRRGLRKCYKCKKQFTARAGTMFESSHVPLHIWLRVFHRMIQDEGDLSTRAVQRMLSCSMTTASRLTSSIRRGMTNEASRSATHRPSDIQLLKEYGDKLDEYLFWRRAKARMGQKGQN